MITPISAVAVIMPLLLSVEVATVGASVELIVEDIDEDIAGVEDGKVMVGVPMQLTPATVG